MSEPMGFDLLAWLPDASQRFNRTMSNNNEITHDVHVVSFPHENETYAYFIAIAKDVGVVAIAKVAPWGWGRSILPFVSGVHVSEGWRRKGLGRNLIRCIADIAKAQHIESLSLYVHEQNLVARSLYESEGFRPMLDDGDNTMFVKFLKERDQEEVIHAAEVTH